jgi:large subunit ribosomal protein L21
MQQGGCMNEFDNRRQVEALTASRKPRAPHVSSKRTGLKAFSTCRYDVSGDVSDQRDCGVEASRNDLVDFKHVAGNERENAGCGGGVMQPRESSPKSCRIIGMHPCRRLWPRAPFMLVGCKPCYTQKLCRNPSAELNKEVYMYAVIKTGGKQYRVASGEKIKVEQIAADVGQEIVIDQVLAVGNGAELKVGTPLVSGATVKATVVAHGKHDKVRIFKMRRRKHYQKRQGHRQQFTELQIGAIAA